MTFAVGCVLFDLARYCTKLVSEIVILSDKELLDNDKALLNRIYPCRFLVYQSPYRDLSVFSEYVTKYFSPMVLGRFEAFRLLDEYSCIINLDYDILITGDISELKTFPSSGVATCKNPPKVRNCFKNEILGYDMEAKSGINNPWIFWDHLPNYKEIYSRCYDLSQKFARELYLPETGIISLAFQEFKIKPDIIFDEDIYNCHPSKINNMERAKIIHCYGQPKFWNGHHNEQWEENYSKWVELGGSPYYARTLKGKMISYARSFLSTLKNEIIRK